MAGYHLCRHRSAERPFFIESLQIGIRSVEELSYFLWRYPALLDEAVMSRDLVQWVSSELNLPRTAARMDKALLDGSGKEFALAVLREAGLLDAQKLSRTIAAYDRLDGMKPAARQKAAADTLLLCGKLSAAIEAYRHAVESLTENARDRELLAACWHDRGVAEMRLMLYEEALHSFRRAMHASEKGQYRTDYLSALLLARPFDRREEEILAEHIGEEELLLAAELVAGARTESQEDLADIPDPADGYLAALTAAYHEATRL